MEEHSRTLPARTLGDLLNETFAIYARRFWRLTGLVAVVQVPVSLLVLIPAGGVVTFAVLAIVDLLAIVVVYGLMICATGQHYLMGEMGVGTCYSRVWRRIVSLLSVALVSAPVIALGAVSLVLVFPATAALSVAVPAVILEGRKPMAALMRIPDIMRGNWLRVSGITVVILLVMIGLGLLVQAPFAVASYMAAPEEANALGNSLRFVGGLVTRIATTSVAAIAFTLLYYDLRVRKEDYDLADLSREMGLATV